jgi:hypothetical protein
VRFASIKVISDAIDDEMDFVGAFVTPTGFKTAAFLAHVAVRPRLWSALSKLNRNSQQAAESLTASLRDFAAGPEEFLASHPTKDLSAQGAGQQARK